MKNAIALLVTLLFIMLITLSIGIGLKHVNQASSYVDDEKFLLQTTTLISDILTLLKTSKELDGISSNMDLNLLLSSSSFIPFEISGFKVTLELSSARSKFNINNLMINNKPDKWRIDSLKQYMSNYMINTNFVDILLDAMGKIKDDISYNTTIFNEKPYLFRNYITSKKHFLELSDFYMKNYYDNNLKNIEFDKLFYFSNDDSYTIDLTYATTEVWEMMLGCDRLRASELSAGYYDSYEGMNLSNEELDIVKKKFKTSFFEPYVDVVLSVVKNDNSAKIRFEYDIKNKKGSNFVYEI